MTSMMRTAVPRVELRTELKHHSPFPYPTPVSGLDQEIEDKIL